MPLGTKIGLGAGHIMLYADPASPAKKDTASQFSVHVYCGQTVSISATAEHFFSLFTSQYMQILNFFLGFLSLPFAPLPPLFILCPCHEVAPSNPS